MKKFDIEFKIKMQMEQCTVQAEEARAGNGNEGNQASTAGGRA